MQAKVLNVAAALAAILAAGAFSALIAPGAKGAFGALLAAIAVLIAIVDWRLMLIPDELNALAFLSGLAVAGLEGGQGWLGALRAPLLRAAALALAFLLFRWAYRRARGREGLGLGDVKLAAVAGVWLDWRSLPIVIELAALAALSYLLLRRVKTKAPIDGFERLPFGSFLAPAIWVCWSLERLFP